ncbi:hypothetical protein DL762_005224 [Monosporascus cannonballus]|uniref:Uncharacterized protein n=1 Tax=Monosporascus cannonballus TaxID=155416 RepID=A0ABY0H5F1_9PEZI|nr:hypothetical protein DL762_005224 [Monosporascus cannonballus]
MVSTTLRVTNETLLRGVIGVDIRAGEAQRLVPGVGGGLVLGAGGELGLGGLAGLDGGVGGAADVDQLVADAVEDDGRVQRLLLALVDDGVDGLEGELAGRAAVERLLELHRRDAGAEVEAERRGLKPQEGPSDGVADRSSALSDLLRWG